MPTWEETFNKHDFGNGLEKLIGYSGRAAKKQTRRSLAKFPE